MFINKQTIWVIGCCLFILSGCSSSQKDVQQASVNQSKKSSKIKELYLQFNANQSLNLNQDKQSLSVTVRIYQLKDNQEFLNSNYKDLLKEKNNNFKQDILTQYDIILKPNNKILLHRPLEKETVYIAIIAFFKHPNLQTNNWKILIRRDNLLKKKPRIIEVNNNTLSLTLTEKELKKGRKQ